MLEAIVVLLVVLWGLGVVGAYTLGGLVHFLLVLAMLVVLARVVRGQAVG